MAITRASAKLKGAEFQRWVRDKLLALFPSLEADDVSTAVGGQNGEDIKLSPAARKLFPYSVECKRLAKIAVYALYEQAVSNAGKNEPLLIMRADRKKALAVVDAEHFFGLVKGNKG